MTKQFTFDELPEVMEIELELDYSYYHLPAKLSGPPELCYPEEEESEITLPKAWEQIVVAKYLAAARLAIKEIENRAQVMEVDGTCREWAEEEKRDLTAFIRRTK